MWGRAWTLHLLVTAATIQLWEQLDLKVSTKIRGNSKKASTNASILLKAPTSASARQNLLGHYHKHAFKHSLYTLIWDA